MIRDFLTTWREVDAFTLAVLFYGSGLIVGLPLAAWVWEGLRRMIR